MDNEKSFAKNTGFLLAALGSAVGFGNLWGFPYKMGANGGFAWLLIYLVLAVFVGTACIMGELAIGRRTGKGVVHAYKAISRKYTIVGYLGIISCFLITCFLAILGGIAVRYCWGFLLEMFGASGFDGLSSTEFFGVFLANASGMVICQLVVCAAALAIVFGGVKGGIEKFLGWAMPALVIIMAGLAIFVGMQPNAAAGYAFMFKPDFTVLAADFFGVFKSAASQMFFSLSIGLGALVTYASYMPKSADLQRNSFIIPVGDTIIALLGGMVVIPACAAYGLDFTSGTGLLYMSLHEVFQNGIGGFLGCFLGAVFYFMIALAGLSSSIAGLEGCTAYVIDKCEEKNKTYDRKKIVLSVAAMAFLFGLPCALDGMGADGAVLSVRAFGYDWLSFYDLLSEGLMMPIGACIMSLIIGWGIGTKFIKEEIESTPDVWMHGYQFFEICFKFVVPVVTLILLYGQLQDFGLIK